MEAKSEIGRKISNFNTSDTFKFRGITENSDFTIHVKEIGINSFNSCLDLWCSNKYGECRAESSSKSTTLTISPDITAPYLSFSFLPSEMKQIRILEPAIIGNYACQITDHISASGELKYLFGQFLPILDLKLSSKFSYFGSDFRTHFYGIPNDSIAGENDDQNVTPFYTAQFSGDIYVTDEVNKANLSLDLEALSRTIIGLHLSNQNTYLSFYVSSLLDYAAYSFSEFEYKNVKFGVRALLKKDDEDLVDGCNMKKEVSVGFRAPIKGGYFGMAFKNPTILSSKLKINVNKRCQISTKISVSNLMLQNPHLGMSICVFPEDVHEIGTKELHRICRPKLSLF